MNEKTYLYSLRITPALVLAVLTGCASVETQWREAEKQNTVGAYERFVHANAYSSYTKSARERMDQLSFEQARSVGTEAAYEQYLRQFPRGHFATEAYRGAPRLAFQKASRANSIKAYEDFSNQFPNHELAAQAAAKARALRYEAARKSESAGVIEDFLKRYPEGEDAETLRKDLPGVREWEPRKRLGTLVMRICPKENFEFLSAPKQTPSATYKEDLAEIQKLLEQGVDPNGVRILGFVASQYQSTVDTTGGTVRMSSNYSMGSPGRVVRAGEGGITLLNYCTANKLTEAAKLLEEHGAK